MTDRGPELVVSFGIESRPRLRVWAATDEQERRLWLWLDRHPELHPLVRRLAELASAPPEDAR